MFNYILINKETRQVTTEEYFAWLSGPGEECRIIKQNHVGDIFISTVFLGLDHGFGSDIPILFETMVFGGVYDQERVRYATYEEAEQSHKETVEKIRHSIGQKSNGFLN